LRQKNFFLFFYLPFLGIILIFFFLSSLNRNFIKENVEKLVEEQLRVTSSLLEVNVSHYLSEDYSSENIFELYSGVSHIYFMALLDSKKDILVWNSHFDGYLPISLKNQGDKHSWIIDSPVGKIFNYFSRFSAKDGNVYYLYLGYSLSDLESMLSHSKKNFFIIFGVICIIGILFFSGLFQLQNRYLAKTREVREQQKEKERFREISAFTSGIAHELKNPLNSLSLLLNLVHKKAPPELSSDTALGKEEIKRISGIIDHFSNAIKPISLKKETFSFMELIQDISRQAEASQLNNHEIEYTGPEKLELQGDRMLLNQAVFNLVKNAMEASESGPVTICAEHKKKTISIVVRNQGKEIPQEDRDRIFSPFFSLKKDGMGIGLYITRKIIEAHEGSINFTSILGEGTSFCIKLPGE